MKTNIPISDLAQFSAEGKGAGVMPDKPWPHVTEVRPKTHGDFSVGAAFTQAVMTLAQEMPSWKKTTPVQREAIHMVVHKLQRILAGDPDYKDHWVDIEGYARLVADRCAE